MITDEEIILLRRELADLRERVTRIERPEPPAGLRDGQTWVPGYGHAPHPGFAINPLGSLMPQATCMQTAPADPAVTLWNALHPADAQPRTTA